MASLFSDIGDALGQYATNRANELGQWFTDPQAAATNRIRTGLGLTTSTVAAPVSAPVMPDQTSAETQRLLAQNAAAAPAVETAPVATPSVTATPLATPAQSNMTAYNANIAQQESGGNPNIGYHDRSKSTAYGPFGITAGAYQDARKLNPSLPTDITQASPEQQTEAMNAFTQQNAGYLRNYGIDVNQNTLAAAHLLGAKGLKDYQDTGYLSPAAIKANGGEENLRKIVNARLGGQMAPASGAAQLNTTGLNAPKLETGNGPTQIPSGAVNPADMGEMAGVDQAVAQQAAMNAGQPQPTEAEQNAAMEREIERQKNYDTLNSNDWKGTLALLENPDKAIANQAASNLEEMFRNNKMKEMAEARVNKDLNDGKIPDIKRAKGEEGSYIKAYLFARLGLNDLAQQEQEKISPSKQHRPVMVGDQHYNATYSKDGELLYARDETGKLVDDATKAKIAANAFATKGATTGQTMMKDAEGNIWSHTTTPGTNQVIWTNQSTGKAQTTAPTGLTPFGQINPVTRANISLATSAERMMMTQNNKDKNAGLQPTYSQEQILAEKERIINGGKPTVKIEGETTTTPVTTEGKREVGEVERRGTPALEAQARAIFEGDQQMPTGMGANNARNQWLSARVQEIAQQEGKTFDPNIFANRKKTEASFTTGKQGDTVRSMNVAIDHLDTLNEAGKALKNGQIPLFNDIANKFAKNTGQQAPTDFNALKSIVGSEVAKAVAGGATALGDREEIRAEINNARSPQQLAGVIDKYQRLLAGQMSGLKTQYESGGGKHWEAKINPRTQEVMDKIHQQAGGANAVPGLPAPYQDTSKEQRYQEWLKKHPEFQGRK